MNADINERVVSHFGEDVKIRRPFFAGALFYRSRLGKGR